MTLATLKTLETLFTRDDERIDDTEAQHLVTAAHAEGIDPDERAELQRLSRTPLVTSSARDRLSAFEASEDHLVSPRTGADESTFDDDLVVLPHDGHEVASAGVTAWSRGWAAVHDGPMRVAHGSKAPNSSVLTRDERTRLDLRTPGQSLDAAAKELGVKLGEGFEHLAWKSSSYDPQAPTWWGKCHAWAWAALSSELSARVDVSGPEGQRGLWLGGEWISRADLGTWLMGVADHVSLSDASTMFDEQVTPMDLLHATGQFLVEGGGFVADLHNDAAHGGEREVWNQPFLGADVTVSSLSPETEQTLLTLAGAEGVDAAHVKRVELSARYGNEQSDAWEGAAAEGQRHWQLYAVTDANGAVRSAWAADDARLATVAGLPSRTSDELPEYVWRPSLEPIRAGLSGAPNPAIDSDSLAREYRFLLGTVLKKGVPGAMRARFEAEVAKQPTGKLSPEVAKRLHDRFPGVEAAYSRAQWARAFANRGL